MTIRQFIREHRDEIDRVIREKTGSASRINDEDRRQWVLNYEPLYGWARVEGVPV